MAQSTEKEFYKITHKTSRISKVYNSELSLSQLKVSNKVEVNLITEGKGIHRILGEAMECEAGDVYIVSSGIPHGYFALEDNILTLETISFEANECFGGDFSDIRSEKFCYGVFRDDSPISYAMLSSKALNEVTFIFSKIQSELTSKKDKWQDAIKSYLVLLLINISRYINLAETQTRIHSKEWNTVSSAIRAVLERCNDSNMTLESIASSLYLSKSRLSRLFQKEVGESFLDFVRNVRINRACGLLKETNLTNEEIVKQCGLKDVPSFYKMFKASKGQTPYQYRMSHTNFSRNNKEVSLISILNDICENTQHGKTKNVKSLMETAIKEGLSPKTILNEGLLRGINVVGEKFKRNEVYVPEVLLAARCMNESIVHLKSFYSTEISEPKGRVCLGTVQGDLHDIGKNLVKMMMESSGLEVIDLGTDVSPENFVKTARENDCHIICCSALLTTTMGVMEQVVEQAIKEGIRDKVKIIIGGSPITEEFAEEIGADLFAPDAFSAAEGALRFCEQSKI